MANSATILSSIDNIIVSNGVGNINADNLRSIAEHLLDIDIRTTGTITADSDSPIHGSISGDFFIRKFYDMNAIASIDYENRRLYRMDGSYFDWEASGSGGAGTVTQIQMIGPAAQFDFTGTTPPSLPITITSSGVIVMNIRDKGINYSLIQDITGGRLLGRYDASPGTPQEITLGPSMGYLIGIDVFGNTFGNLVALSSDGDVIIKFASMRADILMSAAGYTLSSGHGNFIAKRVVYMIKNSPVLLGGPSSPGEFHIIWATSQLSTVNNMQIPVAGASSAKMVQWQDASNAMVSTASQIIPSGTTIYAKNTTASSGWSSTIYDVYVIGFYEFP